MSSRSWMKAHYLDKLKHGAQAIYFQVSRSAPYPISSEKQNAKKYATFTNLLSGHSSIGRVKRSS